MGHADQIIESKRPGTDRPRKVQNQVGRAGHLFECAAGSTKPPAPVCNDPPARPAEGEALYEKVGNGLYAKERASADAGMLLR